MNIRSLSNPAQLRAKDKIEADKKNIKSDHATERDADGRQPYGEGPPRRPLTDEEIEKVLDKLRSHEGIISNNLQVLLVEEGNQRIVKIEDQEGKVVKRIVEAALFDYLYESQDETLHLVRKTA